MNPVKVACLGPKGSFTGIVTKRVFPKADLQFMQTYKGCQQLKEGKVSCVVYPLENNTGGFVYETLLSIYQTAKISIVGLEYEKIQHCLISNCSETTDIETICSHPNTIAQCQSKDRGNSAA